MLCTIQGQEINESDAYGMTLVEAIYRGQNWRCRFTGLEWNKVGLMAALQGFGSQQPTVNGILGPTLTNIGDRWTRYTATLLLTAILGNPPSIPQTLTSISAAIAPQFQTDFLFTSKMREFPMELVLFPYSAVVGSVTENIPFSTT